MCPDWWDLVIRGVEENPSLKERTDRRQKRGQANKAMRGSVSRPV